MKGAAKKLMEANDTSNEDDSKAPSGEKEETEMNSSLCSDKTSTFSEAGITTQDANEKPKLADQRSNSFKENSFGESECNNVLRIGDEYDETETYPESKKVRLE